MSNFKPIDDRASSSEAPVQRTSMIDLYGTAWDERPDNKIRQQVLKLGISTDQHFQVERMINERKWDELLTFLSSLERRSSEGDDKRRLEEARKIVMQVIRDQRSELEDV